MIGTYTGPGLIGVGGVPRALLGLISGRRRRRSRRPPITSPTTAAPDHQLAAVALEMPAPVGQMRDLAAQAVDRDRELHAVALDRAADLGGRALRHQLSASRSGSPR